MSSLVKIRTYTGIQLKRTPEKHVERNGNSNDTMVRLPYPVKCSFIIGRDRTQQR